MGTATPGFEFRRGAVFAFLGFGGERCRAAADAGIERLHRRWSEWEATQGTRLLRIETEGKASEAQLRSTQLALRKLSILSEQVGQPGRAGIVSAAPPAGGSAGPRSLAMAPAAS